MIKTEIFCSVADDAKTAGGRGFFFVFLSAPVKTFVLVPKVVSLFRWCLFIHWCLFDGGGEKWTNTIHRKKGIDDEMFLFFFYIDRKWF